MIQCHPLLSAETPYTPGSTPLETFQKYKHALKNYVKDPNLLIFTKKSREFFMKWVVTDAQQDNSLRDIVTGGPYKIFIKDNLAVIRYAPNKRKSSPFYFVKDDKGWMIDFLSMNKTIIFNHRNCWHFKSRDHRYMFGFRGLRFDKHGFPHPPRKK